MSTSVFVDPVAPRTYAVLGTGAVGGFYGTRLRHAGVEVHFLLHSDYAHVREHGLYLESVDGDVRLDRVDAYAEVRDMPRCDVVIVALKTTSNHLLHELLPPVVKDDGVVLVLQNGLGVEPEVAAFAGTRHVLGGLCFLCSNKVGPGHIRHLDYGTVTLGEYAPSYAAAGITPRLEAVAADFSRAGIDIKPVDDLLSARWRKLLWNIPFNGLSVALDATTEEMMGDAGVRELAADLMREVCAAAAKHGRALPADAVDKMLQATARMKPYKTSMKLDFDARRALELAAIFGTPLRIAAEHDVPMPRTQALYRQLCFLDARNRA